MPTAVPTAQTLTESDLRRVEEALTSVLAGADRSHVEKLLSESGPRRKQIEQLIAAAVTDTDTDDRNRTLERMLGASRTAAI